MLGLYEQQKQSLREQQKLMRQQIQAEKDKKKTDNNKIQQWNDAIKQIEQQIEDLDRQMMETFAGTTTKEAIDQYADAIVDAYCAGAQEDRVSRFRFPAEADGRWHSRKDYRPYGRQKGSDIPQAMLYSVETGCRQQNPPEREAGRDRVPSCQIGRAHV